jgi:hypothetical protein
MRELDPAKREALKARADEIADELAKLDENERQLRAHRQRLRDEQSRVNRRLYG